MKISGAELLQRLRDAHSPGGRQLTPDEERAAREAFDAALEGQGLDAAFGLQALPGQRSWQTRRKLAERDELVRRLRVKRYPGSSDRYAADEISRSLDRYFTSAWRRGDKKSTQCPMRLVGRDQQYFWEILKREEICLTSRSIRQILSKPTAENEWPSSSAFSLATGLGSGWSENTAADSEN